MLFAASVGDDIFGRLTATIHPGFAGKPKETWTFEMRPRSRACVSWIDAQHYYCGGFQGGAADRWIEAMRDMDAMIAADDAAGIVPLWHDESVWNAYLVRNPPDTILPPLYCSPESWNVPGRKLVALDKNHQELRS